jgi:DNA repair photolyase
LPSATSPRCCGANWRAPGYRPRRLNLGSATDCYQPVERELRLTRSMIEVLQDARHPFSLITKSSGVERDLDLIAPMAAQGLAAVYVTVTTLDAQLSRRLEPRAAAPWRRLRTIRALADAGVPVGVSVAPQIPFLTTDMEQVLEAAWEAGARRAFYTVLRLPWEVEPLFRQWLELHAPERAQRVLARVREMISRSASCLALAGSSIGAGPRSPRPTAGRRRCKTTTTHHRGGPGRRAEPHRQALRDRAARALAGAGVRHEGRRGGRRPCAGGADGRHQPALHRRLQRHRAGHNLLAALIDNHIHHGNALGIDLRRIVWRASST